MKDSNDTKTIDAFGAKSKPGPKPSGNALTRAQIQRNYRQRQKERDYSIKRQLEWLQEHGPQLPCPPKIDPFED